jgi:hypothetical protein
MLDIPDLLALRLVSPEAKSWVDFVMSEYKSKDITLYFDEKKGRTLGRFMEERMQNDEAGAIGIPFGSLNLTEVTTSSSFFSHPLIRQFHLDYGPEIHRVINYLRVSYNEGQHDITPLEELTFYQDLPNLCDLTTLSILAPGENAPQVGLPALRYLELLKLEVEAAPVDEDDEDDYFWPLPTLVMNVDFIMNCPNLRQLWLPGPMGMDQYVEILIPLGAYFAARNGRRWGSSGTLTIFIDNSDRNLYNSQLVKQLSETEGAERLIKALAASDGRILIDSMPITLLDKAVGLFSNQPEPGKLSQLRSFAKCIRSLRGFSSSLYEIEVPNMRKMKVDWRLLYEGTERKIDYDYTRTVTSWPKLEEIKIEDHYDDLGEGVNYCYMKKLLFRNVMRPSVERFDFNMSLQALSSDAALLLEKLPNLTELKLYVPAENVDSFRNLIRSLPTSCPKLALLSIEAEYSFGDMDFLGAEDDGELQAPPTLLQLPGKLKI